MFRRARRYTKSHNKGHHQPKNPEEISNVLSLFHAQTGYGNLWARSASLTKKVGCTWLAQPMHWYADHVHLTTIWCLVAGELLELVYASKKWPQAIPIDASFNSKLMTVFLFISLDIMQAHGFLQCPRRYLTQGWRWEDVTSLSAYDLKENREIHNNEDAGSGVAHKFQPALVNISLSFSFACKWPHRKGKDTFAYLIMDRGIKLKNTKKVKMSN